MLAEGPRGSGALRVLRLAFLESVDSVNSFCVFVVYSHVLGRVLDRQILLQELDQLDALAVVYPGVPPLLLCFVIFVGRLFVRVHRNSFDLKRSI